MISTKYVLVAIIVLSSVFLAGCFSFPAPQADVENRDELVIEPKITVVPTTSYTTSRITQPPTTSYTTSRITQPPTTSYTTSPITQPPTAQPSYP